MSDEVKGYEFQVPPGNSAQEPTTLTGVDIYRGLNVPRLRTNIKRAGSGFQRQGRLPRMI